MEPIIFDKLKKSQKCEHELSDKDWRYCTNYDIIAQKTWFQFKCEKCDEVLNFMVPNESIGYITMMLRDGRMDAVEDELLHGNGKDWRITDEN